MPARTESPRPGVSYGSVGATRAPDLLQHPPQGFRAWRRTVKLGFGDNRFELACRQLLNFEVQTRGGFRSVERDGDDLLLCGRLLGIIPVAFPVRLVYEVDEPQRVGFAYGTRSGHPLSGEESFIIDYLPDGDVTLTITHFSRPSTPMWRVLGPMVRLAQRRYNRRYLDALRPR